MNTSRRILLKGAATASLVAAAVAAGLLTPARVLAASVWPTRAFDADTVGAAMSELFQTNEAADSGAIVIRAPDIAENGAVVPITIETDMARVQSITIIAEGNPAPLSAKFDLGPNVRPYVSTRIKMGQTSNIIAVVQADGRVYSARKEVKVTVGGCDA